MRRAEPHELTDQVVTAITAHVSKAEVAKWLPIRFDFIADPLQAPEPSLAALAQLEAGSYVVLNYGLDSEQLIVEVPTTADDISAVLAAFFQEVHLPVSRVLWHRKGVRLPQRTIAKRAIAAKAEKRRSIGSAGLKRARSAMRAEAPAKHK